MERTRVGAVVFVVLVASVTLAGLVLADETTGSPDIEVYTPDPFVEPGESETVTVDLQNRGSVDDDDGPPGAEDDVTTARNVSVELGEDKDVPVDVKTAEQPLTNMPQDAIQSVTFDVDVDQNAEAGTYELPVNLTYTYTPAVDDEDGAEDEKTVTKEKTIEIRVDEQARFEGEIDASEFRVGDTRTATAKVTNTGAENASDAVVGFEAADPNVELFPELPDGDLPDLPDEGEGDPTTVASEVYVGDWEQNETREIDVKVRVSDEALPQENAIRANVEFRDERGVDRSSRELILGADVVDEHRFAVEDVHSTVRVDDDGVVNGTVKNAGDEPVQNAVVQFSEDPSDDIGVLDTGDSETVTPREDSDYVGNLDPGETSEFEFRLDASADASAGDRILPMEVRYRNVDDDVRTSRTLDAPITIGEEREEFTVEATNATFEIDSSGTLELDVTNTFGEDITDVQAKLFTNDPIDSSDDEAFIERLDEDETETITFEVDVDGSASEKTYPVRVDFQFDDEDGDTRLSDTYRIPITTFEGETDWTRIGLLVGLALSAGIGALTWRYRDGIKARLPTDDSDE